MTYPENIEQKLDFPILRARLEGLCESPLGVREAKAMAFETDYETICHLLNETEEMLHVQQDASLGFPDGGIHDISEALARIRVEGLYLDEQELYALRMTLDYAIRLEAFFRRLDTLRFPLLSHCTMACGSLQTIPAEVDRILDRYGQMKDSASPELARIRRELTRAQGSVQRAMQRILHEAQGLGLVEKDTAPTIREGRLVLPVSPAFRRKIGGIVHDESASGKTVYVEPQEVVEANNHIRQLESEESRERVRILTEVTDGIRPLVPDIFHTNQALGHVDFLRAKSRLAAELKAIRPEVTDEPMAAWKEARHAVLYLTFQPQGKSVVPMSIDLNRDQRILVISGPNAGGKSVCLKTVALLQYMLQCGMLVPMREDSRAGVFRNLLIDIGDEQSLLDDLSTYSSHLRNMKQFLRMADAQSLFLIDEFGSGTEPLIGGAIAEAVLKSLNHQQAMGVVTTHYTNLKHLAESEQGMQNGAMLYDRGALRPLFQLSIGQAGSSFAVEIARQIGLGEDIIREATDLVGIEHLDYDKQLQDIARDKRYWENKRQNIRQKEKRLEERVAYYEQEIASLKQKRKQIVEEAKAEASDILQRSNATIERTIREIKEAKADREKTKQARAKVEHLKEEVKPKESAKVLRDLRDLKHLAKQMPKVSSAVANTIHTRKVSFVRTLDMRGMRADEAQEQLIAYMDDAIMVAAGEVTLLHGTGTGALKQLTRDYLARLKRQGRIVDFHDGDINHGGAGLTIVKI